MSTRILIIAHAPLANALRDCALHVFPECSAEVMAMDVPPHEAPEDTLTAARLLLAAEPQSDILVLTDVMGATPANIAQRLVSGLNSRLIAGVNLPMLLRTINYRHESMDSLIARALSSGAQCIVEVAPAAARIEQR
jgi:PTS system ascorbate-specific IIA component